MGSARGGIPSFTLATDACTRRTRPQHYAGSVHLDGVAAMAQVLADSDTPVTIVSIAPGLNLYELLRRFPAAAKQAAGVRAPPPAGARWCDGPARPLPGPAPAHRTTSVTVCMGSDL